MARIDSRGCSINAIDAHLERRELEEDLVEAALERRQVDRDVLEKVILLCARVAHWRLATAAAATDPSRAAACHCCRWTMSCPRKSCTRRVEVCLIRPHHVDHTSSVFLTHPLGRSPAGAGALISSCRPGCRRRGCSQRPCTSRGTPQCRLRRSLGRSRADSRRLRSGRTARSTARAARAP